MDEASFRGFRAREVVRVWAVLGAELDFDV